MPIRSCLLSGMLLAVLTAMSKAQIDNGLPGPQPLDMASVTLNRTLLKGVMDRNQEVRDGKGGASAAGVLVYRRNPAVTEKVKQGYLVRAQRAYGPQVAAGLRQLLAKVDFVQFWTKGSAADGMRPNDLGDSLAEYWATSWAYASGLTATTPAQTKAIRFQLGPTIARNPQVRRMSDAQKQEFSETLMLNLVVEAIRMEAGRRKNDPALLQKLRTQTAARFKQEFGVDLMTLKLTRQGFVKA